MHREEVAQLESLASQLSNLARRAAASDPGNQPEAIDADWIRRLFKARRLRDAAFAPRLFADPAWDMLLELTASRLEERRLSVSSVCVAAAVPASTALRWLGELERRGLVLRARDPADGRRVFAEISEAGAITVLATLAAGRALFPVRNGGVGPHLPSEDG